MHKHTQIMAGTHVTNFKHTTNRSLTMHAQVEALTFAQSEGWQTTDLEEVALRVSACLFAMCVSCVFLTTQ